METLTELFARATELIDSVTALVTDSPITYLVVFALTGLDVLFPVLPAEATVTAAAVLAGTGQLTIGWVMVAAGLGAFVGDNIAYWIGRTAGRPLVERLLRGRSDQIDAVQEQFRVRGGVLIIIGRFIPGGRTTVAIGAGVLHFPWRRFLAYDALAATIWAFQATLPGFIGGVVVQDKPWLALIIGFGLSLLVGGGIVLAQRWWDRRKGILPLGAERASQDETADVGREGDAPADGTTTTDGPAPEPDAAMAGAGLLAARGDETDRSDDGAEAAASPVDPAESEVEDRPAAEEEAAETEIGEADGTAEDADGSAEDAGSTPARLR